MASFLRSDSSEYNPSEKNNHIAYITINRPEALNSFNVDSLFELQKVIRDIHRDTDIRTVIITGVGKKAFSVGADLKERRSLSEEEVYKNVHLIQDVFNDIALLPQPTIAAVNGFALGGGFELMLACDFSIATDYAQMGLTETSWAIIPGAGGTQRLPRLIGEMHAKELIFTARKISAFEAKELGILLDVVPFDNLMNACEELAHRIMSNGPLAVKQAKFAIREGMNVALEEGLAIETTAYEQLIPTTDRLEALYAFNEKRKPHFTGE